MKITNIETYRTKVLNNLKDVFILNWNGTYTESSFKPCYENIGKVRILFNVMEFINYHYDSDLNRVIDRTVLIDVDSEGQVGIWEVKPNEKFFTLVDYVSDYNDNQTVYQMEVVKRLCGILK